MSIQEQIALLTHRTNRAWENARVPLDRFHAELDFAMKFADLFDDTRDEWNELVVKAAERVAAAVDAEGHEDIAKAVAEAEDILAPIGKAAKEYTIHCCGHAHIDMNWKWPWQETINVMRDTFVTIDRLMDEFPDFHFSQSQAAIYLAMEEYCPEVFEMIKRRVREGRWEIIASTWVEGDKNLASGESLCRHFLYTHEYMKTRMGLGENVKIDWSPDAFGHAWTMPSILARAGVSRYYHFRNGPGPWLYKWRSPDGSEILAFNDKDPYAYSGPVHAGFGAAMIPYVKETGLKDFLMMYGVGDHGGGPTRRDLRKAIEMADWPIYPTIKLSTIDAFFSAVENANATLPVVSKDLNFIFEGCYTSQSNIKLANRVSEIILPVAETAACIATALGQFDYPSELLCKAWRWTLFNQFHDILPGTGIGATYEYSQGLFQEIQATASTITSRALSVLAGRVDTASAVGSKTSMLGSGLGDGLGAGAGDPGIPGGVTAINAGAESAEPILIYNQKPWTRSETVYAKVWNKQLEDECVVVRDATGKEIKGQVIERGLYWGHSFTTVAFRAEDVPATGYKVYAIDSTIKPVEANGARISAMLGDIWGIKTPSPEPKIMENEFLKVEIDLASGAICSLIDKQTGREFVPEGELLGLLEICQEAPHDGAAWVIGQTPTVTRLTSGSDTDILRNGPNRVAIISTRKHNNTQIALEIGLNAGSRMVDFKLTTRWLEIGTPETGVPMLRVAFPVKLNDGTPTYEIPFGIQTRKQSTQEIPALKWADVSDDESGLTLVNNCKYGYSCDKNVLRLTLLRATYEPDPLADITDHEIRFGVVPHEGTLNAADAVRAGEEFNTPMAIMSATVQKGDLPSEMSFVEVLTPNVFLSTIKRAENSDALVIRMFETEGRDTTAKIKINSLIRPGAEAMETDILEHPLSVNTARMDGNTLLVAVPAFGQTTVKIG